MINIALCDDEITALDNLRKIIINYIQYKNLEYNVTLFLNGDSLLSSTDYFDIIFLDIKMKGINGIDTAKKLREMDKESHLIFVTSLKEYVFDAFDVSATNYLLKPIDEHKLIYTMDKIIYNIIKNTKDFILLQTGREIKKIKFTEIFFAEVFNHKVSIHTKNGLVNYNKKIEMLQTELNEDFFRCHRSYLLNFKHVKSYTQSIATLTTGEKIPVAKRRSQEFLKEFLLYQRKEV